LRRRQTDACGPVDSLDEGSGVWSREDGVNHSLSQTDIVTQAQLSMLLEGIDW
jgi:hypothetical protein